MKPRNAILMAVVAFILQPFLSGLFPAFLTPNLLLCVVLLCAITMEEDKAIIPIAMCVGFSLLVDFFSNQFSGVTAIIMIVMAVPLFLLRKHFNIEHILFSGLLAVGLSLIHQLLYWGIYKSLGSTYGFLYMLSRIPLAVLPNAIAIFIGLFFISRRMANERRDSYFNLKKY